MRDNLTYYCIGSSADADGETDKGDGEFIPYDTDDNNDRFSPSSFVLDPETDDKYEILGIHYESDDQEYYWVLWKDVKPGEPIGEWVDADDVTMGAIMEWEKLKKQCVTSTT